MENIKTMSRMLQTRDQMLEHEGPPDVDDFLDDCAAEPRVGLLGLSGVEDAGGGRCRMLESFDPAFCNRTGTVLIEITVLCYSNSYNLYTSTSPNTVKIISYSWKFSIGEIYGQFHHLL